jgi:hypothetical protein
MSTVKMIKRVPLLNEDGGVYEPEVGAVVQVDEEIADSLVRGGDAEYCAAPKTEPEPEVAAEPPQVEAPKKRRTRRSKKNAGPAPENKDAGPAPEDK